MIIEALLGKLEKVQGNGPRWRAICPGHESKHQTRSLSIFEPEPDKILLHCHAGCSVQEVAAAVGIELADLFPSRVDEDGVVRRRERRPWRASVVIQALRGELAVAWVLLSDVASAQPHSAEDRARAGVAQERIRHFMDELEHAR